MSGITSSAILGGPASFTPVTNIYNSGTSVTDTAPVGATSRRIRIWGGGGGGSVDGSLGLGNGGASGAYADRTDAVTGGVTAVTFTVGAGAVGTSAATDHDGNPGGDTTVVSPAMTAHGGPGGISGGGALTAPTASGGTTNTSGNIPGSTDPTGKGAPNGGGDVATGGGSTPGGGGHAKYANFGNSTPGAAGRVQIDYT